MNAMSPAVKVLRRNKYTQLHRMCNREREGSLQSHPYIQAYSSCHLVVHRRNYLTWKSILAQCLIVIGKHLSYGPVTMKREPIGYLFISSDVDVAFLVEVMAPLSPMAREHARAKKTSIGLV